MLTRNGYLILTVLLLTMAIAVSACTPIRTTYDRLGNTIQRIIP